MQLRTAGDTSHLQLGLWNLTYRGDLGTLQFDKTNYTTATGSVSVPEIFENDGYGMLSLLTTCRGIRAPEPGVFVGRR